MPATMVTWNMRKSAPGTEMKPAELSTIKGKLQAAMTQHKEKGTAKAVAKKPKPETVSMLANRHCAMSLDKMLTWIMNDGIKLFRFGQDARTFIYFQI